jgi:hypothetical protein
MHPLDLLLAWLAAGIVAAPLATVIFILQHH